MDHRSKRQLCALRTAWSTFFHLELIKPRPLLTCKRAFIIFLKNIYLCDSICVFASHEFSCSFWKYICTCDFFFKKHSFDSFWTTHSCKLFPFWTLSRVLTYTHTLKTRVIDARSAQYVMSAVVHNKGYDTRMIKTRKNMVTVRPLAAIKAKQLRKT